ncbi:MAG: DegV family protein [Enterococcus faecalis]
MNYQLVTDSCCDLPYTYLKENQVPFISMNIQIDGKEYRDDLGETFDYQNFLTAIKNGSMPTTSQVNVGRYNEFFRPFVEQGLPVIYLAFSSGLSGSYQSALQSVEMLKEEYDKIIYQDFKHWSIIIFTFFKLFFNTDYYDWSRCFRSFFTPFHPFLAIVY